MLERQITLGTYGHTLNHRQVVSPDGQWAAYDIRNEDSNIARTDAVEMVHMDSGEIVRLYQTRTQSLYGPGVGAVAFHPHEPRVVFIHGLENNSIENHYTAARRFGAIVNIHHPNAYVHAEARSLHEYRGQRVKESTGRILGGRILGTLSGGTHAHSWNADGWLSFTYNDAWLERQSQIESSVRDIRTVGFMVPGMPIAIESPPGNQACEEFGGTYAAFLAATVTPAARSGSDEIEFAVEECWLGKDRSIAFLGGVRDHTGRIVNEIYTCKLPSHSELHRIVGQSESSASKTGGPLKPVAHCEQRRLTHTVKRKFPGVQGPRNWLVSSPNGKTLYAPMKDDRGIVQLFGIDGATGSIQQITELDFSIESQITLNAAGTTCGFVCQQRIGLATVSTGETRWLSQTSPHRIVGAIHFVEPDRLLFNRRVGTESDGWVQIFVGETE